MAYWPSLSKPSPILGYALDKSSDRNCKLKLSTFWFALFNLMFKQTEDGVPIRGPYGTDGRLVNTSELDECNGRTVLNEHGQKAQLLTTFGDLRVLA